MKKLVALLLALVMTVSLIGCGSTTPAEPAPAEPAPAETPAKDAADMVLTNGTIQTMVSEDDVAEAVAVKDGEIIFVGTSADAEAYIGADTQVIDLEGKYVTPGFIDGHIHAPGPYLTANTELDLMQYGPDLEAYKAALTEFVAAHPDFDIYIVGALDLKAFPNSLATNEWLDEICNDKPISCSDVSLHGRLVNSYALEMCGITKDTPAPPSGTIYYDENGELTGYLSDCSSLLEALPEFTYTDEQYIQAFLDFQAEASSYGLTAIDSGGDSMTYEQVKSIEDDGNLNLRYNMNFFFEPPLNAETAKKAIAYLDEGQAYVDDFITVNQVKFKVDGVPEGKSSYLMEPYAPEAEMPADYVSSAAATLEELTEFVTALNAAGYAVQCHCMGDASVKLAVDAYEASSKVNDTVAIRNKITHVNLLRPEEVVRMGDQHIMALMQPMWFYYDPFFSPLEEQMFGAERFAQEYRLREMWDAGIVITGSQDYPVTYDFAPLHAIEAGATQCSPYPGEDQDIETYTRNAEQALTVWEMLQMYTVNGAYAMHREDDLGKIAVGMKADMVVLDQNLLTCNVKDISDTVVEYTISDGRIVYQSA